MHIWNVINPIRLCYNTIACKKKIIILVGIILMERTFTIASAYDYLLQTSLRQPNPLFKIFWQWKGPERIKLLLWKFERGVLMTNSVRKKRGMTNVETCPLCKLAPDRQGNRASCFYGLWERQTCMVAFPDVHCSKHFSIQTTVVMIV